MEDSLKCQINPLVKYRQTKSIYEIDRLKSLYALVFVKMSVYHFMLYVSADHPRQSSHHRHLLHHRRPHSTVHTLHPTSPKLPNNPYRPVFGT